MVWQGTPTLMKFASHYNVKVYGLHLLDTYRVIVRASNAEHFEFSPQ